MKGAAKDFPMRTFESGANEAPGGAGHRSLTKIDWRFFYILVTPDEQSDPVFIYQGYTRPSLALPRLVHAALHLPSAIDSHQHSAEKLARYRLCASQQIECSPLMVGQIGFLSFDKASPFRIFLSTEETDEQTAEALSRVSHPTLHITSSQLSRIFEDNEFGPKLLRAYAKKVVVHLRDESPEQVEEILTALDQTVAPQEPRSIGHPRNNHNVTIPNEIPIELSGGVFQGVERFNTFNDSGYADAIRHSARFMKMERDRLHGDFPEGFHRQTTDLIIACPGLLFHLSSSKRLRDLLSKPGGERELKEAFRFYARQEGYATLLSPEKAEALLQSPYFQFFTEAWQKEISAFTAALTFQSFNEFCPVVRLPRMLYRSRGKIAMLGNLFRGGSKKEPRPESVNKLANEICREMEEASANLLAGFIDGHAKRIRVAADLPLGWMQAGGIPLGLRHLVSQLPTTPGGLFMGMSLITDRRYFNIGVRQHVVVIRSFNSSDPLRDVLEGIIGKYAAEAGWDFDVEFIDVANEEEFIAACGKIRSPFLIFDGHGSHKSETQVGAIRIGDVDLDVWKLRRKVSIPPIVILSCCDAAPSDRSHASTANGFLSLGARTVFAPVFPVDGPQSALMVARLLYRITTVTRQWCRWHNLPLTWLEIVTAQMRACYATDLLLQLMDDGKLGEAEYREINVEVVNTINQYAPEWHDCLKQRVVQKCRWNEGDYDAYINSRYTVPPSLHYLQLGLPDRILFCHEAFLKKGVVT